MDDDFGPFPPAIKPRFEVFGEPAPHPNKGLDRENTRSKLLSLKALQPVISVNS
jgi:hypothetical protein